MAYELYIIAWFLQFNFTTAFQGYNYEIVLVASEGLLSLAPSKRALAKDNQFHLDYKRALM